MKASSLPSIRVLPELRQAAEAVLKPGETLSALIEEALKLSIAARQTQQAFIARGLASSTSAKQSNNYISGTAVLSELEQRLQRATATQKSAS